MKTSVTVTIDTDQLIEELLYGRHDELIEFVIALDERVGEWDFTMKLCDHFVALRKKYEDEDAEYRAKVHGYRAVQETKETADVQLAGFDKALRNVLSKMGGK